MFLRWAIFLFIAGELRLCLKCLLSHSVFASLLSDGSGRTGGGLVGWEVFQFKSLRFLGPPGVIFIHIHSHGGCRDGAERPSVRIGRVCHTVHLIWCQTDVQITVEPLESIVCLHQCHFRICLSMTSLRSFHPADLSTPYEKTCSRCTQPTDSPPPPLCHLNQFAAAWMFILHILWLDRNPKRKAKVCAVLRCAPSYKSALLWRQSRGRVQLNLVLTKSLSPRLLPADDSVSYQGCREEWGDKNQGGRGLTQANAVCVRHLQLFCSLFIVIESFPRKKHPIFGACILSNL